MERDNDELREQLLALLEGGNAHISMEQMVEGFPEAFYNSKFSSIPYSAWELLEHMQIAQWDILEFIRNADHKSPKWPEGYWPEPVKTADKAAWDQTLSRYQKDLHALKSIIRNPETEFFKPLPHAPKYNIFREILLVADHNAYHLGQLLIIKRLLKLI